jgi:hypothetical protein
MKWLTRRAIKLPETRLKNLRKSRQTCDWSEIDVPFQAVGTRPRSVAQYANCIGKILSGNLRFCHRFVTTADAKIPLSVAQVKHEPQYVVFSCG